MVEMYSKSLVRAMGKIFHMKLSYLTPIRIHKGDEKWPLFVNNNNGGLTDFSHFYHF